MTLSLLLVGLPVLIIAALIISIIMRALNFIIGFTSRLLFIGGSLALIIFITGAIGGSDNHELNTVKEVVGLIGQNILPILIEGFIGLLELIV